MLESDFLKLEKNTFMDIVRNDFKYIKIRFIQTLLNINNNLKFLNIIFLVSLFFLSATIFGFLNMVDGYYHLLLLMIFFSSYIFFFRLILRILSIYP